MARTYDLEKTFVQLVKEIFESSGYSAVEAQNANDYGADLFVQRTSGLSIVELKVYRSPRIPRSTLDRAAQQLAYARTVQHADGAMLVTNVVVDRDESLRIRENFDVTVIDYSDLQAMAASNERLTTGLEDFQREAYNFDTQPSKGFEPRPSQVELPGAAAKKAVTTVPPKKGADFCAQLRATQPGRPGAIDYQDLCEDAVKYVFDDHLISWRRQLPTNTGLHIFDLIARISSEHSFWITLFDQFRTRNPVFEFKNYTEPITQAEIYTTEKYLYPQALRGTAIVIARNGIDDNAKEAVRGALRESGKLILAVSLDDLCRMLSAKDKAGEPSDNLADLLDEILYRVDR